MFLNFPTIQNLQSRKIIKMLDILTLCKCWVCNMPVIKKNRPDLILGQKNTFLVYLLYLLIHLGLSAHILTQGISWDELEPFGGFFHFGLGGSIFGAKNCVFGTFAISLECRYISAAVRRGGQCFWDKNKLWTLLYSCI